VTDFDALPLADPSDMIELHRVFRNCFSQSSSLVGSIAGSSQRAQVVASYYSNVTRLLRVHHEGEDVLVTPKLLARNPDQVDLIERIASQHTALIAVIDRAERRLAAWRSDFDRSAQVELIHALEHLDAELTVHLDAEEAEILPIAGRCMNVAEWGELPSHGMQNFDGDKQWLVLGLIREQLSAEHRAAMDANMPPPAVAMWANIGQTMYTDFMERLHEPTYQP